MSPDKRHRATTSPTSAQKQAEYKRRRIKDQDYSKHAFLDASATVHAGLFGARRLPEIKSLWRGLVDEEIKNGGFKVKKAGQSGGGKTSSRHLRRRTRSHRPRRRHRFPRGDSELLSADGKVDSDGVTVQVEESTLNTKVDLSDEKLTAAKSPEQKSKRVCKKTLSRRARRKPALLKASHSTWWNPTKLHPNPTSEVCHHKWLTTHHWHTKRFHIASLFGWSVPLVHCNRGSRAALRLSDDKCTVQDATWEIDGCALVLSVQGKGEKYPIPELVRLIQRVCGADSSFLRDEEVLRGRKMGEGLIYGIDSFPVDLVGTANFLFVGNGGAATASIMVHPSISLKVLSLFETIIADRDEDFNVTILSMPLSLLRIRGAASLSTLVDVLSVDRESLVSSCTSAYGDEVLSHCSLVEFQAAQPSSCLSQSTVSITDSGLIISASKPNMILIRSHQPNASLHSKELSHNRANSGFDILCHPSITLDIFQRLILKGACAVGVTEHARTYLEASPPLPVFPRDYPDTEAGRSYWTNSLDWAVIRACFEAPWGRMNTTLKRVLKKHCQMGNHNKSYQKEDSGKQVDENHSELGDCLVGSVETLGQKSTIVQWDHLIPTTFSKSHSVIVVRGSFGDPFLAILKGYGKFNTSQPENSKKHKHRRPYRPIVNASPLSNADSQAHFNICLKLLNALSLPAVLKCEVYCDGKGTLETGDLLLPLYDTSSDAVEGDQETRVKTSPLGVVAAGGFSPRRGIYHGVGFVGASRFIEALMHRSVDGRGMKTCGTPKMMLRVHLRKLSADCVVRHAMISLLL